MKAVVVGTFACLLSLLLVVVEGWLPKWLFDRPSLVCCFLAHTHS